MKDTIFKLRRLLKFLRESFENWRETVWRPDLDAPYCCDGRECACFGMTNRELYTPSEGA